MSKKMTNAYLVLYLMSVEALTRNKPIFFQHVVEKKNVPAGWKNTVYLANTRNRQKN